MALKKRRTPPKGRPGRKPSAEGPAIMISMRLRPDVRDRFAERAELLGISQSALLLMMLDATEPKR
jgi:hypothetical protein